MDYDAVLAAAADENGLPLTDGARKVLTAVLEGIDAVDTHWNQRHGSPWVIDYARAVQAALSDNIINGVW